MKRKITETEADFLRLLRHYFRSQPEPQVGIDNQQFFAKELMRLSEEIFHAPKPLDQLVGPVVSTATASAWLRMTRQGIGKAVRQGRLVAIQIGHKWYYPTWQLRDDHQLLPAIVKITKSLPDSYSGVEVATWFYQNNPMLDGKAPYQCIDIEGIAGELIVQVARKADPELAVAPVSLPEQLG